MTIRSFELLRPRSIEEAVELLARHGDNARAIGGGTTLVILMKQRALHYPFLVDLQSIPGLDRITGESDGVRIGALASHRSVELSQLVREAFPMVADAFGRIGNVRVRQTASVGGNLAHADYRLDPPPPLMVLGAEIHTRGPRGARTIAMEDFFCGLYETQLQPAELVVDVKIPFMPAGSKGVYLRYSSLSANDWPCLGVAALRSGKNGRRRLRIALGGVAPTPLLIRGLEAVGDPGVDNSDLEEVLRVVDEQISPSSDMRGSEWYKRKMVRLFVARAIAQLESTGTE